MVELRNGRRSQAKASSRRPPPGGAGSTRTAAASPRRHRGHPAASGRAERPAPFPGPVRGSASTAAAGEAGAGTRWAGGAGDGRGHANPRRGSTITELRRELEATREYLQTIIEEHEATTEELKSGQRGDPLQQRGAPEHQRGAPDRQGGDAVGQRGAVDRQRGAAAPQSPSSASVNDDLLNLFGSVNIPIVMVSRDLRIRRFTPPAERLLNLIATDLGRPIGDIRPNFDFPDLDAASPRSSMTLIAAGPRGPRPRGPLVLGADPALHHRREQDRRRRGGDRRHRRGQAERPSSSRTPATTPTRSSRRSGNPWSSSIAELRVMRANRAFHRLFGTTQRKVEGRHARRAGSGPWPIRSWLAGPAESSDGPALARPREVETELGSQGTPASSRSTPPRSTGMGPATAHDPPGDGGHHRPRSASRSASSSCSASRPRGRGRAANRRKDEFLAMLAHELRNPLAPIRQRAADPALAPSDADRRCRLGRWRSSSARSATWPGWSTTCSTSRAIMRRARSSSAASGSTWPTLIRQRRRDRPPAPRGAPAISSTVELPDRADLARRATRSASTRSSSTC